MRQTLTGRISRAQHYAINQEVEELAQGWGAAVTVILYDKLAAWAESKPQIAALHIFGSRARGDHAPNSDLDIALEFLDVGEELTELACSRSQWKRELSDLSGLTVKNLELRSDKHTVKLPIVAVYRRSAP